jgi:hypothetical protein
MHQIPVYQHWFILNYFPKNRFWQIIKSFWSNDQNLLSGFSMHCFLKHSPFPKYLNGEYSNSPKMANFRRVLEFDKFAGEWPLLKHSPFPKYLTTKENVKEVKYRLNWLEFEYERLIDAWKITDLKRRFNP